MRDLIESIEPDDLIDFLVEYANYNDEFTNALRIKFANADSNEDCETQYVCMKSEVHKINEMIDKALYGITDYRRHDSWGNFYFNTGDIVFEVRERVRQGHIMLAFAMIETLYLKLLAVFEYQGECEISDEAEDCLRLMSEVAEQADDFSDREYIYEHCIDLACSDVGKDYGADYECELFDISARFVTQNNRAKLEEALLKFGKHWRENDIKLVHLAVIRKLDGDAAADAFVAANLKYTKIREIAYNAAIERQDYAEAERLCVDGIDETDARRHGLNWLYELYAVYEHMNDSYKLADTAEKILFSNYWGDLKYYDKLKTILVNNNRWSDEYPALLKKCAERLSFTQYMHILNSENEFELLFEQLRLHPEMVYVYGAALAVHYGDDVRDMFFAQINSEAENADGRGAYHGVCEHILAMANAGFVPVVAELIADYKLRYKRRPAFVNELEMIEGRI